METFHKDIDCNGNAIYYRFDSKFRARRKSKKQAELEIQLGQAKCKPYVPITKSVQEMTDRQLRAKMEQAREIGSEVSERHAREELVKRAEGRA